MSSICPMSILVFGHRRFGRADHPAPSLHRQRPYLGLSAAGARRGRISCHHLFAARISRVRTGPADNLGTSAEDLRGLADHLRLDRFHILGSAAGAFISVAFAVNWPERLRTLTVACSMLLPRDDEFAHLLKSVATEGFSAMPAGFRELSPSYRAVNPEGRALWEELEHLSREGRPAIMQPVGAAITAEALNALPIPALVISGDADLLSPPPVARAFGAPSQGPRDRRSHRMRPFRLLGASRSVQCGLA